MDQVTIGNLSRPPLAVILLFRTFLGRLSFSQLVHVLDLALPQMVPHQRVREQRIEQQLTSHFLNRLAMPGQGGAPQYPEVHLNFLFHSHAGLAHVLFEWHRKPLLVFSDFPKVTTVPIDELRDATTLDLYRQHVALGLRAGQSALFDQVMMIGIVMSSKVPTGRVTYRSQWQRRFAATHYEITPHTSTYRTDWQTLFLPDRSQLVCTILSY